MCCDLMRLGTGIQMVCEQSKYSSSFIYIIQLFYQLLNVYKIMFMSHKHNLISYKDNIFRAYFTSLWNTVQVQSPKSLNVILYCSPHGNQSQVTISWHRSYEITPSHYAQVLNACATLNFGYYLCPLVALWFKNLLFGRETQVDNLII